MVFLFSIPIECHIMNTVKIFLLVLIVTLSFNKQLTENWKHNYYVLILRNKILVQISLSHWFLGCLCQRNSLIASVLV